MKCRETARLLAEPAGPGQQWAGGQWASVLQGVGLLVSKRGCCGTVVQAHVPAFIHACAVPREHMADTITVFSGRPAGLLKLSWKRTLVCTRLYKFTSLCKFAQVYKFAASLCGRSCKRKNPAGLDQVLHWETCKTHDYIQM